MLTLPEPPSSNRYWRVYRNRAVKSGEARAYCKVVAILARGIRPTANPVALTLRWCRHAKRGDLDNRLKVAIDALQGIVYVNDNQIVELHAYRHDDKANPRLEVEWEER